MAKKISIHALREKCDKFNSNSPRCPMRFQSTHSARSATLHRMEHEPGGQTISIHALREECDTRLA